jgi:hypothetical protein
VPRLDRPTFLGFRVDYEIDTSKTKLCDAVAASFELQLPGLDPPLRFEALMFALGHKQTSTHVPRNVRFTPESRRYSITSSARASNVGGMLRPSDVAVLRLIAIL